MVKNKYSHIRGGFWKIPSFIHTDHSSQDDILVYINKSGKGMMDLTEDKFEERYKDDEKNINYRYIEVPDMN